MPVEEEKVNGPVFNEEMTIKLEDLKKEIETLKKDKYALAKDKDALVKENASFKTLQDQN